MKTLIRGGTILTADNEFVADIFIEDEKISMIGEKLCVDADRIYDASGKYVFPGGVDQHTHFDALCNVGDEMTAPYETTQYVPIGGTTTIIDYAPQDPGCGLIDSIDYRINTRAKGKACVDFALHALITEINDKMFNDIAKLPEKGVASIKGFMAYKDSPLHVDDGTLYKVMCEAKKVGVTTFVHAENAELIYMFQQDCIKAGKIEPKYHAVSRPPFVETEATKRAICLAETADAPTFIVHMTTKEATDAVADAKARHKKVYGETCTQYLTLTKDRLDQGDYNESAKYICSPALRDAEDNQNMWNAINNGTLSAIVSDHCGISLTLKQAGRDNFADCPNGAPGAGDRIPRIWTKGVATGKISKQKFVEVCCTLPAKINGIYPRKGTIAVGSDADIVVYDPDYRGKVCHAEIPNGIDYNVYEGEDQIGRPQYVFLRGNLVAQEGKFVGVQGEGRFIESKAFAYCFQEI